MTRNRTSAGGLPQGVGAPRHWARPPGLALLTLAVVALVQAGCRSDGCSTCGISGIGNKLNNGVQALGAKVFHRGTVAGVEGGGCCGGSSLGVEEGTLIDSGVPMTPGSMVVPTPLIPAPVEAPPTDLRPLDSSPTPTGATTTPPQTHSRATTPTGTNRSAYEANRKTPGNRGRFGDIARTVHTPPVASSSTATAATGSSDLLDNLPPVDLPADVMNKAVAPAPTLPESAPTPTLKETKPEPAPMPAAAPAAEHVSATEGAVAMPTLAAPVGPGGTPGIVRCSSVLPHLMGGSLPTAEGLDWLKQRGYKTFLDLRSRAEVDPSFVDSVYDRGMVYVALPLLADRLDSSRLARFDDLVSQADNRPLYFCDVDGLRAGLAWYIHRMTVDHYDPQTAAHEAEEMGLPQDRLKIATSYLAAQKGTHRTESAPAPATKPVAVTAPAPTPVAAPSPVAAESSTPPNLKAAEVELPAASAVAMANPQEATSATPESGEDVAPAEPAPLAPATAGPAPSSETAPADHAGGDTLKPQASNNGRETIRDPMAWKAIATLLLAAVGLPLAYWSRTAVSLARSVKANRPAKVRRSLEARPSSDA